MYKYEAQRYINAGENEIYRYGHKAQERIEAMLIPNEDGFYSIPINGGKYYTIGTSTGKYGEFAKIGGTIFSVNKAGNMWAKEGTEKAEKFVEALKAMIEEMKRINEARTKDEEEEEEE
ncbi:MAG: hypothetical protein K6F53_03705 [Lachnospiraceae bacterium]|nr:hypothetical protein [Lachnospiraceae bacterium]